MGLRHEGMERLHKSMNLYVKAISKRNEAEDKEKSLPVGYLGKVMINHGEDFEHESEFGQCLIGFGRTQQIIAQIQETFIADATSSWLESLERSLAQMKDYQTARKKLDTRRLAYDTSLTKLERQKKEDFRVEEELRNARAKFDETSDDVYRRMQDIKEAEADSVADLEAFLEAELTYHEKCREALLQLRREWPVARHQSLPQARSSRPHPRPRTNTGSQNPYAQRYVPADDPSPPSSPEPEQRPIIKSTRSGLSRLATESPMKDYVSASNSRPAISRLTTFEGPTKIRNDASPTSQLPPLARVPSDSLTIRTQRSQLRNVNNAVLDGDVFDDPTDSQFSNSSPDRSYGDASVSPATSHGSVAGARFKGPPPPPPSRSKKPPPPPPPAKRSVLS